MKVSDQCHKWSEADATYLGKCPDLITGIHGNDPVKLYAEHHEVVEDVIRHFEAEGGLFLLRACGPCRKSLEGRRLGYDPRRRRLGPQPAPLTGRGFPTMKTVEMSEATGPLSEYAKRAHHETLVITEGGKPVAALVPIEEVDLESLSLGTNPDFLALIEQSRARCHPGAGISTGEMRERLAARQPDR